MPEDEVPPGARWSFIRHAHECQAYGKRESPWGFYENFLEAGASWTR